MQTSSFHLDPTATGNFREPDISVFKMPKGLSEDVVRQISARKKEPTWMLERRLKGFAYFMERPMPTWGADLSEIDFNNIIYYWQPSETKTKNWDDVPPEMRRTYDRLGIPQAEQKYLAGVGAQYESEVIYHNLQKRLADKGVIFCDVETATKEYPDIVKEYFGTIIPANDNKFAALNTAVWSGGSFIYVPKGVSIDLPLQAYFRINAENMGQFERTLIIADEGSYVHYVEGCSAPKYSSGSLHSAAVEIIVKRNARVRYTTIQNWSTNVYNLVTKRAKVFGDATMEWIDGNLGSYKTMKFPCVVLMEPGAHGEVLSLAFAGKGQHQDAGAKAIHLAPYTTSRVVAKSVAQRGGRTSYRGLLKVAPQAHHAKSNVRCDALILDPESRSDTYPTMDIQNDVVDIAHEATVSKVGEDQLFYLQSRGLDEATAEAMIVNGFMEPIVRELPMEYAVEMNRLIQLQMEGSVG